MRVSLLMFFFALSAHAGELDSCWQQFSSEPQHLAWPGSSKLGGGMFWGRKFVPATSDELASNGKDPNHYYGPEQNGYAVFDFSKMPYLFSWSETTGFLQADKDAAKYTVDLASGKITSTDGQTWEGSLPVEARKFANPKQVGSFLSLMKNNLVANGAAKESWNSNYIPTLDCATKIMNQTQANLNYKASVTDPSKPLPMDGSGSAAH